MGARYIQFRGRDPVLKAYEANNIAAWAIFCIDNYRASSAKILFMKGSGADQLEAALLLLEEGTASGVYTLQVYEDIEVKNIKSNTPHDGGFNFTVDELTAPQANEAAGQSKALISTLSGINKRLEMLEDQKGSEPDKLGIIGQICDHPVLGRILEQIALKAIDTVLPKASGSVAGGSDVLSMRAVGNISTDQELLKALEDLKAADPDLTKHLLKLAEISRSEPATFKMILQALEGA